MASLETSTIPAVSVIVPARNEETCLSTCLESLVAQERITKEIIVVDDHSTDGTREIASSFRDVKVVEADRLRSGWTGKNNALVTGARHARGGWLLFTDADTVHFPGSLARAVAEAQSHTADMLSYSPEQLAGTFWERAVMPVIFAELASVYRPSRVSDPDSPIAAANGQYLLIRREAYDAIGGHAAVADNLLEDVALARAMKRSGRKIFFRYGGDAVRTRMYRSFSQLREGWTKNLVLLFPHPEVLAAFRLLEGGVFLASVALLAAALATQHLWLALGFALPPALILKRISRAHFSWSTNLLAPIGLFTFSSLLVRSIQAHSRGGVEWKGRKYSGVSNESTAKRSPEVLADSR